MIYRTILKEAWLILWRYRILWSFGIFAGILGNAGELGIIFNTMTVLENEQVIFDNLSAAAETNFLTNFWKTFQDWYGLDPVNSTIFIVMLLFIVVLVVALMMLSQAAMIDAIDRIHHRKRPRFQETIDRVTPIAPKLFGLHLWMKAFQALVIVGIGSPVVIWMIGHQAVAPLWTLILVLLFVPFSFIISFVSKYASAFLVIERRSVHESILAGWGLLCRHWLVSLEMAVILAFVFIVVTIISAIFGGLVALPFIILTFLGTGVASFGTAWFFFLFMVVVILATLLFINALFSAYNYTCWIKLFFELQEGRVTPKIVRWLNPERA
jgi:hypothetical protein